jgi:hypothetical protein
MSPISCLVGVLDIRGGIGTLSPLRIRSADGTITGRGSFDIYRRQIDITVASEAHTTSLFALDVPLRVNGCARRVPHQVSHRHPVNDPKRPFSTVTETGVMDSAGCRCNSCEPTGRWA